MGDARGRSPLPFKEDAQDAFFKRVY